MKSEDKRLNELLQKLRSGRVTPDEQAELNAMAQSEPMLADALEGFEMLSPMERKRHIQAVQETIEHKRGHLPLTRNIGWWRLAAAAAIIGIVGIWGLYQVFPVTNNQYADTTMEDRRPENESDITATEELGNNSTGSVQALRNSDARADKAQPADEGEPVAAREKKSTDRPVQPKSAPPKVAETGDSETEPRAEQELIDPSNVTGNRARSGQGIQLIDGVVIDGVPLDRAMTSDNLQVVVSEGRALAVPVAGRKQYASYIRENFKLELLAGVDSTMVCEVEFRLNSEGIPQNPKVVESTGEIYNTELIRLILEGSRWDIDSAQVPVGRVRIEYVVN